MDTTDAETTVELKNLSSFAMMAELRQKVAEWYMSQKYSDDAFEVCMSIVDRLCSTMGSQETYTPQVGLAYLDCLSNQHLSDYTKERYNRLIYVFNCFVYGKPDLSLRRASRTDLVPPDSTEEEITDMPMWQLRQMIEAYQPLHLPRDFLYVYDGLCYFLGQGVAYTQQIGQAFLAAQLEKDISDRYKRLYQRIVYVLDSLISNEPIQIRRHAEMSYPVPSGFSSVFEDYLSRCKIQGNMPGTISLKHQYVSRFLNYLDSCGCSDISELTPGGVLKASLVACPPGAYTCYRDFLKYLADEELSFVDYSPLIPKCKKKTKLPDIYSKGEILDLESSYDRETDDGKRDYAIVLLASRLMLRPSDIVTLMFDDVDFEKEHLQFSQGKTRKELRLPLLPELKQALLDYIKVRPKSDSPYIFLRSRAPYLPLTSASVHHITTTGFDAADVDPNGRETGPRSLRKSGASHMINSGETYKVVSDSLGHKDKNVIQHYARLDIPQLRKCALTPSPVTAGSIFERILKGQVIL